MNVLSTTPPLSPGTYKGIDIKALEGKNVKNDKNPLSKEDINSTENATSLKNSEVTNKNLTEEERRQVEKLKQRDQEVRTHERAHIAAGGKYVRGGASFQYERGPDGRLYAIGGEVSIDVSPVPNNPSATIKKMETVIRAALAPSQPSGQDYQVAARAQMEISKAQMELLHKRGKETYSSFGRRAPSSGGSDISLIA
ncbi:MAG: hypothetical protein N2260_07130 [Syntrophobacterales bacterium]|nr:hypothetical protein [Syntrophobacterales bacterium]